MRALHVSAMATLAITGCMGAEDEGAEGRVSGVFLVRRDVNACAEGAPACERYLASAVNGTSTRCADGVMRAACELHTIDLNALGLSVGEARSLLASVSPSLDAPTVAVRGRIVADANGPRLVASDAWRAPFAMPVRGTFVEVSTAGSTCAYLPCPSFSERRVNAETEPVAVSGVDVSALTRMDASVRDAVLAAAASDTGVLVAGTLSARDGATPVVRAEQVFLRVQPASTTTVCGASLEQCLTEASSRLLYSSATDAPYAPVSRADATALRSPDALRATFQAPADAPVRAESLDAFLQRAGADAASAQPAAQMYGARLRVLGRVLRAQLRDITVFHVGEGETRVLILGTTACGGLAGIETRAME